MRPTRARRGLLVLSALAATLALGGCSVVSATATGGDAALGAGTSPSPTTSVHAAVADDPVVVMIGDSLMSGYGLDPDDAWPVFLADDTGLDIVNLACGGMGFVAVGDCGVDFDGVIDEAVALQPDIVVIQASDNDFLYDDDEVDVATAITIGRLRDELPSTTAIVGLSTLWNADPELPDDLGPNNDALWDAIESVGGTFIDLGQPLTDHPEWIQDDGAHPNVEGQQALAASIGASLRVAGVLPR